MQGRDNNDKNNIDQIHSMMSFGNPVNIGQSPTLSSFSNFGGLFGSGVWGDATSGVAPDKESISTGANTSIGNTSMGSTTTSHMGSSTGSVNSNQWVRPTPPPRPPPGFESYNSQQRGVMSTVAGGGAYNSESGPVLGLGPPGLVPPGLPSAPGLSHQGLGGPTQVLSQGFGHGHGQGLVRSIPPPSYPSSLLSPSTIASTLLSSYEPVPVPLSHAQNHNIHRDMHHHSDDNNIINNTHINNNNNNTATVNHNPNHNIMEELLRLEIDHQQLQQEKIQQRQQQQQLLQRAKVTAATMSMSSSAATSIASLSTMSNHNLNYDNNYENNSSNNNNPGNNYDNIYNTTNSLISDNIAKRPSPHQLINPPSSPAKQLCAEQVLLSAASLMQNQIHRSTMSSKSNATSADPMSVSSDTSSYNSGGGSGQGSQSSSTRKAFSEFNAIPSLPTDCGGPCHPSQIPPSVLEREMSADESMYDEILTGRVPTIDTIHRSATNHSIHTNPLNTHTIHTLSIHTQNTSSQYTLTLSIHTHSLTLNTHSIHTHLITYQYTLSL